MLRPTSAPVRAPICGGCASPIANGKVVLLTRLFALVLAMRKGQVAGIVSRAR